MYTGNKKKVENAQNLLKDSYAKIWEVVMRKCLVLKYVSWYVCLIYYSLCYYSSASDILSFMVGIPLIGVQVISWHWRIELVCSGFMSHSLCEINAAFRSDCLEDNSIYMMSIVSKKGLWCFAGV